MKKSIAIIGGGTLALYILKAFVDEGNTDASLDIFEAGESIGVGMPYSARWANPEHRVNIACKEIPELLEEPHDWLSRQSDAFLQQYGIQRSEINSLFVLPRIVFGKYHQSQFFSLMEIARQKNLVVSIHTNCKVTHIEEHARITICTQDNSEFRFDHIIVATGHEWPVEKEHIIEGYFDSPFPLTKLSMEVNQPIALLGSSLSAVDAIKTLARHHGHFTYNKNRRLQYIPNSNTENFKIVMYSRRGLLPSVRYYLEHPRIRKYEYISKKEIETNILNNNGYLSLDYVFEKSYKDTIRKKDPTVYQQIKHMDIEQFANYYYEQEGITNENIFEHFRQLVQIGKLSEKNQQPIYWREAIEDTFYTLNFHAKSLSAEDMIRLRNIFMPLYYHAVIFMPFDSCDELLALHDAGKLDIVSMGYDSSISTREGKKGATFHYRNSRGEEVNTHFDTVIDCRGQQQLPFKAFPFKNLIKQGSISPAKIKFKSSNSIKKTNLPLGCAVIEEGSQYALNLPGVAFNDNFQAIRKNGSTNKNLYIIATPYIKGMNPDLSGIPFCNDAARMIVNAINNN